MRSVIAKIKKAVGSGARFGVSWRLIFVSALLFPAIASCDQGLQGEIYNISVSHRGDMLAVSAPYGVQVYSMSQGALVFSFRSQSPVSFQGIYSYIAWSPDDQFLAVGKPNYGVRIWRTSDWTLIGDKGEVPTGYELPGFAWSPSGDKLALGLGRPEILVWDRSSNSWTSITVYRDDQVGVTWGTGGELLVLGLHGLYDAHTGKLVKSLSTGIDGGYAYTAWSPDKIHLYSFFDLGGSILNMDTNEFEQFSSCCYSEVAWSMDGRYFAAVPERSTEITVWDTVLQRVVRRKAEDVSIAALAWLPNGELLALGTRGWQTEVWNTNSGHVMLTLRP